MPPEPSLPMKQTFLQYGRELEKLTHRKVNARWVPFLLEKEKI
jgi:hypothetical protein